MTVYSLTRRLRSPAALPATAWLIGLWIAVMLSVPILKWAGGPLALQLGVQLGVGAQVLAVLTALQAAWGWRRTGAVLVLVLAVTWTVEWLGSRTGVPFGAYTYTELLQPQLASVPILVPLAWMMMLPPAWAVAAALGAANRPALFCVVSAAAFTAWDLYLDPQMVAWGYWQWLAPGLYFGIPLSNFFGWFLSAALITALVRPWSVPVLPLLVIYTVTCGLQFIGQFAFWGMPGPALAGLAVMGGFALLGWRRVT